MSKETVYKVCDLILQNPCYRCKGKGWFLGIFVRETCYQCKGTGAKGGNPEYEYVPTGQKVTVRE